MPSLQSSAETPFQLNADEQIRKTCDRFYRAEARERGYEKFIAKQDRIISEKDAQLLEKEKENAYPKSLLAKNGIQTD